MSIVTSPVVANLPAEYFKRHRERNLEYARCLQYVPSNLLEWLCAIVTIYTLAPTLHRRWHRCAITTSCLYILHFCLHWSIVYKAWCVLYTVLAVLHDAVPNTCCRHICYNKQYSFSFCSILFRDLPLCSLLFLRGLLIIPSCSKLFYSCSLSRLLEPSSTCCSFHLWLG
jgi:hypothetical protein